MQTQPIDIQGLWLPLITPFRDGELDEISLRRLIGHYAAEPLDGLILCATTGEGITVDASETRRIVSIAADELAQIGSRLPVLLGLSGSDTKQVVHTVQDTASWADRWLPDHLSVLLATVAGRALSTFYNGCRQHRTANPHLQHSLSYRRQHAQCHDVAFGRASKHCRRQGLRGQC